MTVIPLGARLPAPSSNLPGRHGPGRPPSLFGLAPDGVCRACRVAAASGGLLPHRFTLTAQSRAAVCFLWRCPRVAPPGCYPASCPVEPGLSSPGQRPAATVCPAPAVLIGGSAGGSFRNVLLFCSIMKGLKYVQTLSSVRQRRRFGRRSGLFRQREMLAPEDQALAIGAAQNLLAALQLNE